MGLFKKEAGNLTTKDRDFLAGLAHGILYCIRHAPEDVSAFIDKGEARATGARREGMESGL